MGQGRGGALVRLYHYVSFPTKVEMLLYVDDVNLPAYDQCGMETALYGIWLMSVLGTPWAWKKFRGGQVPWIG